MDAEVIQDGNAWYVAHEDGDLAGPFDDAQDAQLAAERALSSKPSRKRRSTWRAPWWP